MTNKLKDCMIMHCLGDTLGFKNGLWEFYSGDSYSALINKLSEFINLGGINNISLKDWYASDDTIMHIIILKCLNKYGNNMDKLEQKTKKEFIKLYSYFKNSKINRIPGQTTIKYLQLLKENRKNNKFDEYAGGNGCAMRNLCIGIYYKNNLDDLIKYSIFSSKLTHPNPIGWLGGLLSAFFSYCAINNKNINDWLFLFLDLLKSKNIITYCEDNNESLVAYNDAVNLIYKYVNNKFNSNHLVYEDLSNINFSNRLLKYSNLFINGHSGGRSGISCCLIAYDCLIDSKDNFEQLLIYSIMNNYDTDTIGCVSFGLYGILYGTKNISKNLLEHLEFNKEINELCKKY